MAVWVVRWIGVDRWQSGSIDGDPGRGGRLQAARGMIDSMIKPFLVGLGTTFRHMFKKKVAVNYPEQKIPMFPKYRGKQVLMRDENGLEKCVACGLCSVACPADAIYLEAAENDGTVQAGPRY
ncbi:MAG TPA: NADH-quinone oxidoreductase subunit I, partial [Thermoanaerobaculia bacterium]